MYNAVAMIYFLGSLYVLAFSSKQFSNKKTNGIVLGNEDSVVRPRVVRTLEAIFRLIGAINDS